MLTRNVYLPIGPSIPLSSFGMRRGSMTELPGTSDWRRFGQQLRRPRRGSEWWPRSKRPSNRLRRETTSLGGFGEGDDYWARRRLASTHREMDWPSPQPTNSLSIGDSWNPVINSSSLQRSCVAVFCDREEPGKDRRLGLPFHRAGSTTETWKDDGGNRLPLGYMWKGRSQGRGLQHSRNLSTLCCKRFHGIRI